MCALWTVSFLVKTSEIRKNIGGEGRRRPRCGNPDFLPPVQGLPVPARGSHISVVPTTLWCSGSIIVLGEHGLYR